MGIIGIDTGGTFTDTVVITEGSPPAVGKAFSTPPNFDEGVINSLQAAADDAGQSLRQLLSSSSVIAHGTTVGLNALLTGHGAKVGLLVTEGFESTLPLAKTNKFYGLAPEKISNALHWRKPDLLVPRHRILGVRERIDARGETILPLDEAQARAAIASLLAHDVDAIGICLLWSTVEPRHEQRLRDLIAQLDPDILVTLSCELAPRLGEYERTSSVAVNAFVAPLVGTYLENLSDSLHHEGFAGQLLAVTMAGGVLPYRTVVGQPIHTLQSGPAAGLEGARQLGNQLQHTNIIATDVGGTSFDVGLVVNGELPLSREPMVERQALAVPIVEINSIGTGGGSIVWVDKALGSVKVGPASAGSRPGPACYGKGGKLPTLTDASVVLGYIDRLGADLALDPIAAGAAIEEHVARPLNITTVEAASGIYEVAVAQMSDLIRQMTVRRGHDPTQFWLYAYGGAAPQYASRYGAELRTLGTMIPHLAPEFSAYGAAISDSRARVECEIAPCTASTSMPWIPVRFEELAKRAANQLGLHSVHANNRLRVEHFVSLRFQRQLNTIEIELLNGVGTAESMNTAIDHFKQRYLALTGALPTDAPIELVGLAVLASAPRHGPKDTVPRSRMPQANSTSERTAVFNGIEQDCPVHHWDSLGSEGKVSGPAFIESDQTTVVVFPGQSAHFDDELNLYLAASNVS